jgi:hypothetical protein
VHVRCVVGAGLTHAASRLARASPAPSIRLRRQTSYTTIALVSALLAGVSFLAYATPPAQLFSAAGGSAAADALAPTPAPHGHHHPTKSQWQEWSHDAVVITYKVMFDIYGVGASREGAWAHAALPRARCVLTRRSCSQWCRSPLRSTWPARFAPRASSSSSTASPPRRS